MSAPQETDHNELLKRGLARWQEFVWKHGLLILISTAIACFFAIKFIAGNLGINTDTSDMLSAKLPWRASYLQYTDEFPHSTDTLTIVVDARTADEASDAALLMASKLAQETDLFEWVYLPRLDEFFQKNGLLYLGVEELEQLADRIAQIQPLLARLADAPDLAGLFGLLRDAAQAHQRGESMDMGATLSTLADTVDQNLRAPDEQAVRVSWQTLMSAGDSMNSDSQAIIQVKPRLDFSRLLPGETAVLRIRELARELELTPDKGISVRQTGSAALGYEELQSVSAGARKAGLLALVMVTAVLLIGLRSLVLVFATLVTLLTGLIFTAAFASLAIGELNMISVAFAVLYIGLGVDFAIHYCLRYRELGIDQNKARALDSTSRNIGASLVICAVTTALGFYAFVPTAYAGVAELGLISGSGMFISLLVSLTVLPALLRVLPKPAGKIHKPENAHGRWQAIPVHYARAVLFIAIVLGLASLSTIPLAQFDHNPIHLHDAQTESVRTYRDLLERSELSPLSISALASDAATAKAWKAQLETRSAVHAVGFIDDLIPSAQDDKLAVVEDLQLILGEIPEISLAKQIREHETLSALDALLESIAQLPGSSSQNPVDRDFRSLRQSLRRLADELETADPAQREALLSKMNVALLGNLSGRIQSLNLSLNARAISAETLPETIRDRWRSASGKLRLEIWPSKDLDDNQNLEDFVAQVRSVVGHAATGAPIINVEASTAVTAAFRQAFTYALLANVFVIWLLLKRLRDVLLVLGPLLLAGALTGALTVLMGTPFNFANIIALPLLLGMGVDSAVHMLHRQRTQPATAGRVLGTSTARGVLFSVLTTTCSFGNLAVSTHAGTASMGVLLTIGVLFTLLCTLFVLPAMMSTSFFSKPPISVDKPWDAQLAAALVRPLINTPITPNMLTTVRLILGIAGAAVLASGKNLNTGACLLFASNFVDHTDGELARMSGKTSRIGHLYDLASDALVTIAMFTCIGIGLTDVMGRGAVAMGLIAGLAIMAIFHMRFEIEEWHGKSATQQPRFAGFEAEDILYLFPLVTFFGVLPQFLVAASIGAPIAAVIVSLVYYRVRRRTQA